MVPLAKEQAEWAIRLNEACQAAQEKADYDDAELVPADLTEHVKRIDPCEIGEAGIETSYAQSQGLWVESAECSGDLAYTEAFVREIIRKFDQPKAVGFEWYFDYSSYATIVTKDEIKTFSSYDWLNEQMEILDGGQCPS